MDIGSMVVGGVGVLSANLIVLRLLWIRLTKLEDDKMGVSLHNEKEKQSDIRFDDLEKTVQLLRSDNKEEHNSLAKCLKEVKNDQRGILQAIHDLELKVVGG